jgi:glycosyltransferase involved in cell wall biosynthesis
LISHSRIVFVHSSDEMYGADRMLLEFVGALGEEAREQAQVWLPTDLPHSANPLCRTLESQGVTVRHLSLPVLRRSNSTARGIAELAVGARNTVKWFREARPDVVCATTSATFLMSPAARIAKVPQVVGQVQEIWSASDSRMLAPLARSNHSLIAISHSVASSLPAFLRPRTTIVPNATAEPTHWSPIRHRDAPLSFVVASRWNGWKGHRTLLAAWSMLGDPGRLVVLGGPPPSGEVVDVPDIVARLNLAESVTVIGEVLDCDPYFQDADVIIVPSDQPEPFGLVAIESLARGRPVVGSAARGLAEIIEDGINGWLFPPGNAAALTQILQSLDHRAVIEAGRRAREAYERHYNVERFRENWQRAMHLDNVR